MRVEDIKLKNRIMRRVYAVWFFRKLTSPFAVETLAFFVMLVWMSVHVSFGSVLANARPTFGSPFSVTNFFINAFWSTEFATKALFLVSAVLFFATLRNIWKTLSNAVLLRV